MSNTDRLEKLLGFDAAKPQSITEGILKEVVGELEEQRVEEAKAAAKEQVSKAIELRRKMHKAKREFDSQFAKFEKELGKMMNRLEAGLRGESASEESGDSAES